MCIRDRYIGVAEKSRYGFNCVLLLPFAEYSRQTNQWLIWIFVAVFISFAILAIVTFSQIWLLSRPIKALEKEMAYFSDGNFEVSEYLSLIHIWKKAGKKKDKRAESVVYRL